MKKWLCCALTLCFAVFGVGCGPEIIHKIDKNKTQIYISVYDGGTGTEWIDKLAKEWNAREEKYEVVIVPEKQSVPNIIKNLQSGVTSATSPSVYYTAEGGFSEAIYQDILEDLSPLLAKKPDGENGQTVGEKLGRTEGYAELWKAFASKNGGGMYMLPYADSVSGLVFDYDLFREQGWLIRAKVSDLDKATSDGIPCELGSSGLVCTRKCDYYDAGETVMSAGKDGTFGTYDDGQPQTLAEWEQMLNTIKYTNINNKGAKCFLWTGQFSGYADQVVYMAMAQYAGLSEFETFYSYEGEVTIDGQKERITPDTGYRVYSMDAYAEAIKFFDSYIHNPDYYNSDSLNTSNSHEDAQSLFLLGHRASQPQQPQSAMLIDGLWWENEARAMFNTIARTEPERAFGKRDYRFMLLPALNGQKGIDGAGNGSVVAVQNSGALVVPKQKDADKLSKIYDFLSLTFTEENLRAFNVSTGVINPYKYAITEEDRTRLTPFAKSAYDLYSDHENIAVVRPYLSYGCNPLTFAATGFMKSKLPVRDTDKKVYTDVAKAYRQNIGNSSFSAQSLIDGAKSYYTQAEWTKFVEAARKSGFFQG